jgi:hypothetical protein
MNFTAMRVGRKGFWQFGPRAWSLEQPASAGQDTRLNHKSYISFRVLLPLETNNDSFFSKAKPINS